MRAADRAFWSWFLGVLVLLVVVGCPQVAEASLAVSKVATPTVASPGSTITYTITVYNSNPVGWGPDQLDVTDTLPAGFGAPTTTSITLNGVAQTLETPQSLGGNAYRWRRAGAHYLLNPDNYLIITFTSTISGGAGNGAYPNSVTVTDNASPPDPSVSTGPTAVVTIGNPPSLAVLKAVSPSTVTGAQVVTYTATVTNSGASATTGVAFTDTLPNGFAYVPGSSTYDGSPVGNPAIAGQTLTWSGLGQVPADTSRVLTFQATTTATSGNYDNTIAVSASNALTASSGPTATVTVNGAAPVTITKTASTATVNPGNTFTYTITIANPAGNPVAQISSIEDLLPPNFNYGFSTTYSVNGGGFGTIADPSQTGQTLTWTSGLTAIPAGGNVRLRFTVYAPTEYSGTFSNVATVNGVNFASVSTPPTAAVTVNGPAYSIGKTVNGGGTATVTVPPATTVAYRITITNGNGTNGTPVIRDVLASGFGYVAGTTQVRRNGTLVSSANPTISGQTLTWSPGSTINSTQTLTVDFQASVPAGTTAGVYPNNATVTDLNIGGNAPVATGDTAQVIVNSGGPNMQVGKTVDRSAVLAFETVVYTIHVANLPTATNGATGLTITDTLPTGFAFQPGTAQLSLNGGAYGALANPTIAGQTLTWSSGLPNPMAIGNSLDLRFTAQVSGSPGTYSNTVTVGGSNFTDVTTGLTAPVTVGTPPNVAITKSASPSTVPTPGNNTAYTITLTNTGGQPATNVSVTDSLPTGFSIINGSSTFNGVAIGNPSGSTGTVTWTGPFTIPAGGSATLAFGARTTTTPGTYNNSASTTGSNFSPVSFGPGATVTVGTAPNVSIAESLSASSVTVPPATTLTVTVDLSNAAGAATANASTLTVTLPDNVSYVLGSAQQSVNGGAFAAVANPSGTTYAITFSGLAAIVGGQTNRLTFQVSVAGTAVSGAYYLTAQATGSNFVSPSLGANDNNGATTDAPQLSVTGSSAVDLVTFRARASLARVDLDWETGAEWRNLGFQVYRSTSATGPGDLMTPDLIGLTGNRQGGQYAWSDTGVTAGQTYYYWLEDLEFGGTSTRRGPLAVTVPTADAPEVTVTWQPPSVPMGKTAPDPAAPGVTTRSAAQQLDHLVQVVERTGTSLTLELTTPTASVQTVDGRAEVVIPGLSHVWEDGLLRLPQAVVPVAIPAGVAYDLQVLQEGDVVTIPAPALLANEYLPAPSAPASAGAPAATAPYLETRGMPKTGNGVGLVNAADTPAGSGVMASPSAPPAASPLPAVPASGAPADAPAGTTGPATTAMSVAVPNLGMATPGKSAQHLQFAFGVLGAPAAPAQAAMIGLDGQAGENRLLQVKLFPVRPAPGSGDLIQARKLRVRLQWDGDDSASDPVVAPDGYARALAALLDGRAGWSLQAAGQTRITDDWVTPTGPAFLLTVSQPGLQELTAEQLSAAGVPLTQPDKWQLLDHNRQVPIEVRQSGGQFRAMRFYLPTVGGRYARDSRLVLATDRPGTPLRMASRSAAPVAAAPNVTAESAVSEVAGATYYWANMPDDGASDHWFGDYVAPDHAAVMTLDARAPLAEAAELRLGLRGMGGDSRETENNVVDVALNGTALGTLRWSGSQYLAGNLTVPAGLLTDGANALRLTMGTRAGVRVLAVYVDQASLHYRRTWVSAADVGQVAAPAEATGVVRTDAPEATVYDVTRSEAPVALTDTVLADGALRLRLDGTTGLQRFAVAEAGTLATPAVARVADVPVLHDSQQADYLIVAPQAFQAAAERLAAYRRGQGRMVTVVPAEAVWYEFGGGNVEPDALRAFLRWTAYNWDKPRPTHVVLMGDGHFDYRNDFGTSPTNWLPPLLAANPAIGEIADDNALVCVMGDDPLPDLFIGRLPVNSPAEADRLVDKIVTADQPLVEPWQKQAIAVADDDDPGFAALIGQTAETFATQRQWLRLGMDAHDDLLQSWNGGASLVLYVGHGSLVGWGSESVFSDADLDGLTANGQTALVVAADCLNGYFQDPDFPSLGELLLRAENKGAMAVFATGGYTLPEAQYPLVRQFLTAALLGKQELGAAATMAKLQMALEDAPMWHEELRGWNLLGDPASRLPGVLP